CLSTLPLSTAFTPSSLSELLPSVRCIALDTLPSKAAVVRGQAARARRARDRAAASFCSRCERNAFAACRSCEPEFCHPTPSSPPLWQREHPRVHACAVSAPRDRTAFEVLLRSQPPIRTAPIMQPVAETIRLIAKNRLMRWCLRDRHCIRR